MENPIKMDDLGGFPIFLETPKWGLDPITTGMIPQWRGVSQWFASDILPSYASREVKSNCGTSRGQKKSTSQKKWGMILNQPNPTNPTNQPT